MGVKNDTSTTKYEIRATFEIDGVVEKPDIIGGIYGQTDGLLSENLDIRELQKTGKIGRISVELSSKGGKTTGIIIIPSSLPRMETAILAATVETVDRVGPCSCKIYLEEIVDVRINKRQSIVDRASEIIRQWDQNVSPFSSSITSEVEKESKKPSKTSQIMSLGDEGFSAGPSFDRQKKIILVEGRADVINLLKYGIDNTIAVNGTSVSPKLVELIKKKTVTVFLDGDRGGDLILKELLQVAHVEFVARAPKGKEVEDLNETEVNKALKEVLPLEEAIFLTGTDEGLTVKEFLKKEKVGKRKIPTFKRIKKDSKLQIKVKPKEPPQEDTHKTVKPQESAVKKPSTEVKAETAIKAKIQPSERPTSRSTSRPTPRSSQSSASRTYTKKSDTVTRRSSTSTQRTAARPPRKEIRKVELPEPIIKIVNETKTKLQAIVLDSKYKELLTSPAAEIFDKIEGIEGGSILVIDGIMTQRLLERAYSKGIKTVIGARKGEITKKPTNLKIIEFKQL